ncbi:MAG: tRNA preQ1(34) S-adenosylmethionine ribosyltransferase-isomerase QueA [Alphaproteobacteria bacterium]|jgi:S-adenosylmethionine:tRNA ribosyltransferase-isomerase|nr:tRNA preQ1(34) S-adenosylmethionine ribosyltransferase-isomerase QueA [Alphaproteobacteria bacterium]MBT7942711.1 tRNA preQ1(34) S-adenosylmethionine ribosyltransferase-isomerase QueA [Alphaproteobacteria bacterium]
MRVSDFDFDLPAELIAQSPAQPRESARLLVVGPDFRDLSIADLPTLIRPGDVLVVNDTRVIPVRLIGKKDSGTKIHVTLLKPLKPDTWQALSRPARKLNPGDRITFAAGFSCAVSDKGLEGEISLTFDLSQAELMAALDAHGTMPLPPYIKRGEAGDPLDRENYQTMFAENPGAVAAPTAGLHFTPGLRKAVEAVGARIEQLTLHVGAGTFLPVKVEDTRDHKMHSEWGKITATTADVINGASENGGRIVAVGTTALRLLETAANEDGTVRPFSGETDIFLTPGCRFKVVDALLTNFHLPCSTLFMLVSAFSGQDTMKTAYAHAIAAGYRFYSYGDACWLERNDTP